jgi:hypothetical protein
MSDDAETEPVTISTAEYLRLLESDFTLKALQGAGVDNWDGYGEADWDWVEQSVAAARERL